MAMTDAVKAARIIETMENYSVAADGRHILPAAMAGQSLNEDYAHCDKTFWRQVLENTEASWNQPFNFEGCVLSNWTPRIPGLYFAPGSAAMRAAAERYVPDYNGGWTEYVSVAKSARVIGGVGTLLLPPDHNGFALCSITYEGNSSLGVPVLLSPEVMEAHRLQQGCAMDIKQARWVKMSMDWAQRFPSIKGIPCGYLLINKPEMVTVTGRDQSVELHPCTIMEYEKSGSLFYDYVYVGADTGDADYRKQPERFFEYYRTHQGRNGRYLLGCDMAEPIFDAVYQSPADLRTGYDSGQMALMLERIQETHFNNHTANELAQLLPGLYSTSNAVRTLARTIELPSAAANKDDSTAKMIVELLHECIQHQKMDELIDRVAMKHPGALINP